ncbi:hypothetical protein GCM10023314_01500 [Algibacter agarivorans]|uniref:Uncharacterized protein n=1 Tax=Algibacter agarivorans TaxID=1109741 RepID=A0ABP9G8G0_9FLAO
MMESLKYNTSFEKIEISELPENLNIEGTQINRCTDNARLIVANNPERDIKYIEGFMMILQDNRYRAVAHAWNTLDGSHFDVSSKLFSEKHPDVSAEWVGYFPCGEVGFKCIPKQIRNITPFTEQFAPIVKFMNKHYPVK